MSTHHVSLTPAEWSVMECLWEAAPLTGREVTQKMQQSCGWSRSTTLTLLSRMEGGKKAFRPLVCREDAALQETEDFLERVYKGSLSLMVSALTRRQTLSKEEIDGLYAILRELEENDDA